MNFDIPDVRKISPFSFSIVKFGGLGKLRLEKLKLSATLYFKLYAAIAYNLQK
jgi:hypothetical protein